MIETRWVGHLRASKSIFENYEHIIKTLPQITRLAGFDGDDVSIAIGIREVMGSHEFLFTLIYMKDLLQLIEPVTKSLQSRKIGYKDAMPLIRAVYTKIEKMRTQENFDRYYSQMTDLLKKVASDAGELAQGRERSRPVRERRRSTMLQQYAVEETLGERSEDSVILKSAFFETIDIVLNEMQYRFIKENAILTAIDSAEEMDLEKLRPLEELGIQLPTEIELQIAKEYLNEIRKENEELNKKKMPEENIVNTAVLAELYKVRHGMQSVYNLFAAIETFPSGTAVCESSFSALTRVMQPKRVSMTTARLNNLSFLAFEHKRLEAIDVDAVLKRFNDLKNRKVQLY